MSKTSPEFRLMNDMVQTSIGYKHKLRYELKHLLRITLKDKPETSTANRRILLHGTRTENLTSILRTGLKTDPINSRVNSKMLGNGIYTTNVMTKAAYYCFKRKGPGFISCAR